MGRPVSFDTDSTAQRDAEARIANARARPVTPESARTDMQFILQFAPDFRVSRTGEAEYTGECAVNRRDPSLRFKWRASTPQGVVFLAAAYFRERAGARTAGISSDAPSEIALKIVNAALNGKTQLADNLTNMYLKECQK